MINFPIENRVQTDILIKLKHRSMLALTLDKLFEMTSEHVLAHHVSLGGSSGNPDILSPAPIGLVHL